MLMNDKIILLTISLHPQALFGNKKKVSYISENDLHESESVFCYISQGLTKDMPVHEIICNCYTVRKFSCDFQFANFQFPNY